MLGIKPVDRLHDIELGQCYLRLRIVGIMELDTMHQLSLRTSGNRFVMDCTESHAGKGITVKFGFKFLSINPFGRKSLERKSVADADIEIAVELAGNTGRRIIYGRLRIRDRKSRSEERRGGKEGRFRWWPYTLKKKK